jgi:hypothetical protein
MVILESHFFGISFLQMTKIRGGNPKKKKKKRRLVGKEVGGVGCGLLLIMENNIFK